MGRVGIEPSSV